MTQGYIDWLPEVVWSDKWMKGVTIEGLASGPTISGGKVCRSSVNL